METQSQSLFDDSPYLEEEELRKLYLTPELFQTIPLSEWRAHRVLPVLFDSRTQILSAVVGHSSSIHWLKEVQERHSLSTLLVYRSDARSLQTFLEILEKEIASRPSVPLFLGELIRSASLQRVVVVDRPSPERDLWARLLAQIGVRPEIFSTAEEFLQFLGQFETDLVERDDLFLGAPKPVTHVYLSLSTAGKNDPKPLGEKIASALGSPTVVWFSSYSELLLESRESNHRALTESTLDQFMAEANFFRAGLELLRQGDLLQSIKILRKVKSDDPEYKNAQYILGKATFKRGDLRKAIEALESALHAGSTAEERRHNIKAHYLIGKSYERLHEFQTAIGAYEKVFSEDPSFKDVSRRLDRCRERLSRQAFRESRPISSSEPRYKIIQEIGRGGMGIIYRATDIALDREVALKVLSSSLRNDPKIIATFTREAKSCAALNHVNIVTIFDAGIDVEGNYYIAMEFIRGKTIREILRVKHRFSISSVGKICRQVCRGLRYAHRHKIVHRDLTTNNMMLTENRIIKIMDFGLARIVEHLHSEQSIIGGTPFFMSPEQVDGSSIDHRTDIYSLGVSLFEMATGRVPFPGENPGYHHMHTPPPDPMLLNPDIPDWLKRVILKCLEKRPENRFQDVDSILEMIPSEL